MFVLAAVDAVHYLFTIPLSLLSIFLVLVILVQRGRGGGLTGALGGMGGQSAFGTKAGDLFTRITIIIAAIWILLSMTALSVLKTRSTTANLSRGQRGITAPPTLPNSPDAATPPASGATPPAGDATAPAPAAPTAPASPAPASSTPAPSSPAPAGDAPAKSAAP